MTTESFPDQSRVKEEQESVDPALLALYPDPKRLVCRGCAQTG
jgi:hypothetical protein